LSPSAVQSILLHTLRNHLWLDAFVCLMELVGFQHQELAPSAILKQEIRRPRPFVLTGTKSSPRFDADGNTLYLKENAEVWAVLKVTYSPGSRTLLVEVVDNKKRESPRRFQCSSAQFNAQVILNLRKICLHCSVPCQLPGLYVQQWNDTVIKAGVFRFSEGSGLVPLEGVVDLFFAVTGRRLPKGAVAYFLQKEEWAGTLGDKNFGIAGVDRMNGAKRDDANTSSDPVDWRQLPCSWEDFRRQSMFEENLKDSADQCACNVLADSEQAGLKQPRKDCAECGNHRSWGTQEANVCPKLSCGAKLETTGSHVDSDDFYCESCGLEILSTKFWKCDNQQGHYCCSECHSKAELRFRGKFKARDGSVGLLQQQWKELSGASNGLMSESGLHQWTAELAGLIEVDLGGREGGIANDMSAGICRHLFVEHFHYVMQGVGFGVPREISDLLWSVAFTSQRDRFLITVKGVVDKDPDGQSLEHYVTMTFVPSEHEQTVLDELFKTGRTVRLIELPMQFGLPRDSAFSKSGLYYAKMLEDKPGNLKLYSAPACRNEDELVNFVQPDQADFHLTLVNEFCPAQTIREADLLHLVCGSATSSGDAPKRMVFGKEYCTHQGFERFLSHFKIDVSAKGRQAIWDDLVKAPLVYKSGATKSGPGKALRSTAGMDPDDLTVGNLVRFGELDDPYSLMGQLGQILSGGLWSDALIKMARDYLRVQVTDIEVADMLSDVKQTKYGLYPLHCVPILLKRCSARGVSFLMMKQMVVSMRMDITDATLHDAFDLLDKDNNDCLTQMEFISGFAVLIKTILPDLVLSATKMTLPQIIPRLVSSLTTIIFVFLFLIFAFNAFTAQRGGLSSLIESLVTAFVALGANVSTSTDLAVLKKAVVNQIRDIMGMEMQSEQDDEAPPPEHSAQESLRPPSKKLRSVRYDLSIACETKGSGVFSGEVSDDKLPDHFVFKVGEQVSVAPIVVPPGKYPNMGIRAQLPKGLRISQTDPDKPFKLEGTPESACPLRSYKVYLGEVQTKISFAVVPNTTNPHRIKLSTGPHLTIAPILLCGQQHMYRKLEKPVEPKRAVSCVRCGESQGPWEVSCCQLCLEEDLLLCPRCYLLRTELPGVAWGVHCGSGDSEKLTLKVVTSESKELRPDCETSLKWTANPTLPSLSAENDKGTTATILFRDLRQERFVQVQCGELPPLQLFVGFAQQKK